MSRFTGREGQVGTALTLQEALKKSLLKNVLGGLPILLTGEREFIEIPARAARREDEGAAEAAAPGGDRAAVAAMSGERTAVEIAVGRLRRIDPGAARAGLGHASPGES